MMYPRAVMRAALQTAIPDPTALDAVVVDIDTMRRLAVAARAWLLSDDVDAPPEMRIELTSGACTALAVVSAATSMARSRGVEWPWRECLRDHPQTTTATP